jgi:hypothetical protein
MVLSYDYMVMSIGLYKRLEVCQMKNYQLLDEGSALRRKRLIP